ncbi:MAG: hypothetical protein LQ346_008573 [Caloplaca aetnensis]|nr:MAG: hypothetical protein LQ346_008573 [Caloplaca aetnensis]
MPYLSCLFALVGLYASLAQGAVTCPNTLAFYNPNLRTACYNATWFIVPVPKAAAESVVQPYKLITPPASDKTLFPAGLSAGTHPVVVSTGLQNDIRMSLLQIKEALFSGSIYVPYTDRLNDGKTPFNYGVRNYIGGLNGEDVRGLIPAIVATLGGTTVFVASFIPENEAYARVAPNEFIAQVKQVIVPNPISGPEVKPEAFDLDFTTTSSPLYTDKAFHALINQPIILTNGLCQRNTYYFNETFTAPASRSGNLTLYGPISGSVPQALAGKYTKQGGYSANGEIVGYNPETCSVAAARLDPKALQ